MKTIEIFYDIISPYAYLGLELFSRHSLSRTIDFTISPVSLGLILGKTGNPGPANIAPKRKGALLDFCMQSAKHEIPAIGPPEHPFNPMPATRFIHSIENSTLRFKATLALNAYCWGQGKAVDDEECITEALKETDFFQDEWSDIKSFIKENRGRQKLKETTYRALELDVFGVPTFRYDGINFWGSDRLDLLQEYINNPDKLTDNHYQKMITTPAGL